jgi:hypothetical protein
VKRHSGNEVFHLPKANDDMMRAYSKPQGKSPAAPGASRGRARGRVRGRRGASRRGVPVGQGWEEGMGQGLTHSYLQISLCLPPGPPHRSAGHSSYGASHPGLHPWLLVSLHGAFSWHTSWRDPFLSHLQSFLSWTGQRTRTWFYLEQAR